MTEMKMNLFYVVHEDSGPPYYMAGPFRNAVQADSWIRGKPVDERKHLIVVAEEVTVHRVG